MPKFTDEQQAIIDSIAANPEQSLLGASVAGSGKTTTACEAAKGTPAGTLALAFNRKNREDFKARMPEHVESHTFNSLGHKVLFRALGRGMKFDGYKVRNIVKAWTQDAGEPNLYFGTVRAIELAKQMGYVPAGVQGAKTLCLPEDYYEALAALNDDETASASVIDSLLRVSIDQAVRGKLIDYSDQIYLPIVLRLSVDRRHTVIADEVQDLSPIQHVWLQRLVTKRLIGFGDPHQAIYGWRGADCRSVETLQSLFSMATLPMTYCFRCPEAVIREAQRLVPHIQAPQGTREGSVTTLTSDQFSLGSIRDGDVVLCRNNAPIHGLAIKLLLSGTRPNVLGSGDMAHGLANFPKNQFKHRDETDLEVTLRALDRWLEIELDRAKSDSKKERLRDKAECIQLFAAGQKTVGDYRNAVIDTLKEGSGTVTLSTIHKFKGMENSRVLFLDSHLLYPDWFMKKASPDELQQAQNLEYVAITRAGDDLIYCNSDSLKDAGDA